LGTSGFFAWATQKKKNSQNVAIQTKRFLFCVRSVGFRFGHDHPVFSTVLPVLAMRAHHVVHELCDGCSWLGVSQERQVRIMRRVVHVRRVQNTGMVKRPNVWVVGRKSFGLSVGFFPSFFVVGRRRTRHIFSPPQIKKTSKPP